LGGLSHRLGRRRRDHGVKRDWRGQHSEKPGSKAYIFPKAALFHGRFAFNALN
jgi:hypothetical protein